MDPVRPDRTGDTTEHADADQRLAQLAQRFAPEPGWEAADTAALDDDDPAHPDTERVRRLRADRAAKRVRDAHAAYQAQTAARLASREHRRMVDDAVARVRRGAGDGGTA